jgi:hypothetical protein
MLIIEHMFITKHFPIFFSFCHQIKQFFCLFTLNPKDYKCFFSIRNKRQHIKHKKRMIDSLFQKKFKNNFRPLFGSTSYFLHFSLF